MVICKTLSGVLDGRVVAAAVGHIVATSHIRYSPQYVGKPGLFANCESVYFAPNATSILVFLVVLCTCT